jgi:hypothetical protein
MRGRCFAGGIAVGALVCVSLGCGGDGSGGRVAVTLRPDPGCASLGLNPFPPGLSLLPDGASAVALSFDPPTVLPLDLNGDVPRMLAGVPDLGIPDDSDGDGVNEGSTSVPAAPLLDDVFATDPELAAARLGLVTASGYDEVIVFDPALGELVDVEVEVDAGFAPSDFRRLPAPGSSALRTAISAEACVRPLAPIASDGSDYAQGVPTSFFCDPSVAGSFYAGFTSGAAVAAGRLFVSMSNLGSSASALYLPGAVLVYDTDLGADPPWVSPSVDRPVVETLDPPGGVDDALFNPTHVDRVEAAGRELVLVTLSGAIGIQQDDPGTPAVELGALPLSPAGVQVLDPDTLEIVGSTGPVADAAFGFGGVAVHPSGRVGVVGSAAHRSVYVIDLQPLAALTTPGDVLAEALPVSELAVPALPGGPSPSICPGSTAGVAFSDAGDALYVSERCDGSFTRFDVALPASGSRIDAGHFALASSLQLLASLAPQNFGAQRDPGVLRVRPGRPGIDYTGPDLFFLSGQPSAQLCALRVESP